jgi:hypothetical protein
MKIAGVAPAALEARVVSVNEDIEGRSAGDAQLPAVDSPLTEDAVLALLKRADLSPEVLEQLSKNGSLVKSRKVKLALVTHAKTPRHVSLPLVRHLYTFDLMKVALTPAVPADVKIAADEVLVGRMETVSLGERLSLAHRGSARVAGALLLDADARVMQAALENPRLTEGSIVKAIVRAGTAQALVDMLCRHSKWSLRQEIRIALLRNGKIPLARALEFARGLPPTQLREILQASRLPASTKSALLRELGSKADSAI